MNNNQDLIGKEFLTSWDEPCEVISADRSGQQWVVVRYTWNPNMVRYALADFVRQRLSDTNTPHKKIGR